MHHLQPVGERGPLCHAFLDPVLDRLDVVVGGPLDRLDFRGVVVGEILGQPVEECVVVGGKRLQRLEIGHARQVPEPRQLHPHTLPDQTGFGKHTGKRRQPRRVAAVEWR